jgi:hypothetical protein
MTLDLWIMINNLANELKIEVRSSGCLARFSKRETGEGNSFSWYVFSPRPMGSYFQVTGHLNLHAHWLRVPPP